MRGIRSSLSGIGGHFGMAYPPVWNPGLLTDPNCVAWYRFENDFPTDAHVDDCKGGNDLHLIGSPDRDSNHFKGKYSVHFDRNSDEYIYEHDIDLDVGFPWRFNDGAGVIKNGSFCCWFLMHEAAPNPWYYYFLMGKGAGLRLSVLKAGIGVGIGKPLNPDGDRTWYPRLTLHIASGVAAENFTLDSLLINVATWYHVAVTYEDATRAYRLRAREKGGSPQEIVGNAANNVAILMALYFNCAGPADDDHFSGLIDEAVVFNDVLTASEIDKISEGSYRY